MNISAIQPRWLRLAAHTACYVVFVIVLNAIGILEAIWKGCKSLRKYNSEMFGDFRAGWR